MIIYLKGKILNKRNGYIVLENNSIGYKVYLNENICSDLVVGSECEFYIYQKVKEDALDLYGFRSLEELELFDLLLSISGVGPKSAFCIINIGHAQEIKDSIANGDHTLINQAQGIGKKTAERIVLELREKVGSLSFCDDLKFPNNINIQSSSSNDEIEALIALGYSFMQAREALQGVGDEFIDSGDRIREALKRLSR